VTDGTPPSNYQPGQLRAFLNSMREEVGDDPELLKQTLTDLHAQQRQDMRDHFDTRLEFSKQVTALRSAALGGIVEYGSQTLKWAFLLNAGAVVAILAFAGAIGKPPQGGAAAQNLAPMVRALWPFAVGCILVVASGASAYINFCYVEGSIPASEGLFNFMASRSTSWPPAKLQKEGETRATFHNRMAWRINLWRNIAIGTAFASMLLFAYGVFRVMRAVT
jgi:hypothetical protein